MKGFLDNRKIIRVAVMATTCFFLMVTGASATNGDRNGDGIPDRWAKRHHLNPKANQAHRDQDRDRVENLCEYEAGMDPRDKNSDDDRRTDGREDGDRDGMVNAVESAVATDCDNADSDGDGMEDGDEISGYVQSLDGDILRIRMVDGTILKAPLNEWAYISCEHDDYSEPPKGQDDPPQNEDDPVESESVRAANGGGDWDPGCGPEALVPGRVVKAFFVEDGYFVKVKLLL